jgi:hypothetical protein
MGVSGGSQVRFGSKPALTTAKSPFCFAWISGHRPNGSGGLRHLQQNKIGNDDSAKRCKLDYSPSALNFGSTQTAFGILIGFVSLDFGLTT